MSRLGGWDFHTHIVPPAVVAAGERGAFGMGRSSGTPTICAHSVPLHPLSAACIGIRLVAGSTDARWAGVIMGTHTGKISYASAELDHALGHLDEALRRRSNAERAFGNRLKQSGKS